jgi:hypothetical protein
MCLKQLGIISPAIAKNIKNNLHKFPHQSDQCRLKTFSFRNALEPVSQWFAFGILTSKYRMGA